MELLNNQQEKIAKQIHDLKELHDKLATISNEIYVSKTKDVLIFRIFHELEDYENKFGKID